MVSLALLREMIIIFLYFFAFLHSVLDNAMVQSAGSALHACNLCS